MHELTNQPEYTKKKKRKKKKIHLSSLQKYWQNMASPDGNR